MPPDDATPANTGTLTLPMPPAPPVASPAGAAGLGNAAGTALAMATAAAALALLARLVRFELPESARSATVGLGPPQAVPPEAAVVAVLSESWAPLPAWLPSFETPW